MTATISEIIATVADSAVIYESHAFQERLSCVKEDPPTDISIHTLDTYGQKMRFAALLLNISPDIIQRFGNDLLLWLWLNVEENQKRAIIEQYAIATGEDATLLEKVRVVLEKQGIHQHALLFQKTYALCKRLEETIKEIDDKEILRDSADTTLLPQEMIKYNVIGVQTEGRIFPDFAIGWKYIPSDEGKQFSIEMDMFIGFALLYRGIPQAVCSFFPIDMDTLTIYQLQGINIEAADEDGKFRRLDGRKRYGDRPIGLLALDWQKFLVDYAEHIAIAHGFSRLCIRHGKYHHMTKARYKSTGEPHLSLERATEIYDHTAERLDFVQGIDRNWYRE